MHRTWMRRWAHGSVILLLLWVVAGPGSSSDISWVQSASVCHPKSDQILRKASQKTGQGRPPRPKGKDVAAKKLTMDMKNADSAEELVHLLVNSVDGPVFNCFHASCAYHRVATWKRRGKLPESVDSNGLPQLNKRVQQMTKEGLLDAQALSNVLWSVAYLFDDFPSVLGAVPTIVAQIGLKAKDLKPQELSNVLWASANLKDDAPAVLDFVPAIVAEVPLKAKDMKPQELSNVLWAAASLKDDAPSVLDLVPAIAAEVPNKAKDMKPQELSNVLWASANLRDDAPAVLDLVPAIAVQVKVNAHDMIPQHLANILWASAKLKDDAPAVLDLVPAIVAEVPVKAKDLDAQGLANILWASAKLKDDAPAVLDLVPAIVAQVPLKAQDMKPQELSNSLMGLIDLQDLVPGIKAFFADESGSELPFVRVAASRVTNLIPKLTGSNLLLNVPVAIWACAKVGLQDDDLLSAAAKRLGSKKNISSLSAWGLCALVGSYELLDSTDQYYDFREMLQAELTKRRLSQSDVGWSLEGPLEWARASK